MERLAEGPKTVGEAAAGLPLSKPAISKHVRLLEDAGLVRRAVEGREHRLRLVPLQITEAERWIERHRQLWEAKFDAVERFFAADGEGGEA